jgi:prepilin-type N-terminal cleavage/methylation domain-containing protein
MSRLIPNVSERSRRHGMTLVEILISLVLLGIVSGVIMRVVMRQQRFYQGVNQIITQRSQLRQATSVVPIDLRSLSSIGNDILVASDSSMEIMVNVGVGVVCEVIDGAQVALPPEKLVSQQTLTSWFGYGEPDPLGNLDYTVYIYNDSSFAGNEDDRWQPFMLKGIHHDKTKCLAQYTSIGDVGVDRPVLELKSSEPSDAVTGGPLSRYIGVGAPVRIVKRVRYKLFQDTDGKWYLGYSEYDRSAVSYLNLSPVSGPYDPYTTDTGTGTGIGFRYYDVDGNEIASGAGSTDRARIARIDLIARARTSANVRAAGIQNGADQQYRDSLAVSVMLRNRN